MRVGATRYRWEFQLKPDETADDFREITRLHPLIAPWTKDIPVEQLEIVRVAEYVFRAQVADRWRDRRIFLLGDAAHLTPPFIGQGMGAGVRDAANLSWKLAGVLQGRLPHSVLDTYEIERKPHVRALIRTAKLVGTAMTAGGRLGDLLRRVVAPHLHHVPGLQQHILDGQTPRLRRSALVVRPRLRRTSAGRLCPNPLLDHRHFDDVVAGRLALVTTIEAHHPTAGPHRAVRRRARRGTGGHRVAHLARAWSCPRCDRAARRRGPPRRPRPRRAVRRTASAQRLRTSGIRGGPTGSRVLCPAAGIAAQPSSYWKVKASGDWLAAAASQRIEDRGVAPWRRRRPVCVATKASASAPVARVPDRGRRLHPVAAGVPVRLARSMSAVVS